MSGGAHTLDTNRLGEVFDYLYASDLSDAHREWVDRFHESWEQYD
jgi:hypothetical protein